MPNNLRAFPIARTVTELPPIEQYWTIAQVAERLHAGESTVKRWLSTKQLSKTKAGDKTLISESNLQAFLRKCTRG